MVDDNDNAGQEGEDKNTGANQDDKDKTENSELSPLEEARKLNAENKKILEGLKQERIKIEKATADFLVGGKSFAGAGKIEPKKETDKEYAQRVMRGEI